MKMRKGLLLTLAAAVIVMAGCGKTEKQPGSESNQAGQTDQTNQKDQTNQTQAGGEDTSKKSWSEMPAMAIDTDKSYKAVFKTNKGEFTVELFAKDAPQTVNSFVFLSNEKFYDGITFHRIVEDFMIQTGDPKGNGTGGPGYNIPDELKNGYKYEDGIVAMANTGRANSGGSQFFICTGPAAAGLNKTPNYTIFGKVTEGMDIVREIAKTPVELNPASGETSAPTEEVKIETIRIDVQ